MERTSVGSPGERYEVRKSVEHLRLVSYQDKIDAVPSKIIKCRAWVHRDEGGCLDEKRQENGDEL